MKLTAGLVENISCSIETHPSIGCERPLDDQRLRRLRNPKLKHTVSLKNGIIDLLLKCESISLQQKRWIESETHDDECTERLLAIMRRRSVKDYNKFIECLAEDEQDQAVDLLLDKGGNVE